MHRNKLLILAVVVLCTVTAVVIWWMNRDDGAAPDNAPREVIDTVLPIDKLFLSFDANHDGQLIWEEFEPAYVKAAAAPDAFQINRGPGQPPLTAKEAFDSLDKNKDKKIDRDDNQEAYDRAWLTFKQAAAARGLDARLWRKKWLTFNPHQVATLDREMGAEARKEVPFAGAFFARKYFEARRYVSVRGAGGEVFSGFAWEDRVNNRLHVLGQNATLRVFDPGKDVVTELAAAPELDYIEVVQKTSFEDPVANLRLARRCMDLGLKTEAGMMYARVLIFDPNNQEALDALGLKKDGPMFVSKGG